MTVPELIDRDPIPILPDGPERKRLRRAFGVSQTELAATLHVSRQMITRYERGSNPTGDTLVKYAQILTEWGARERARKN
jgi:transcriptional regulator with XRE-family HTH domain